MTAAPNRTFLMLLAGAFVGLSASSCIIDDPNHCANRSGAQTCQELGMGNFCSKCSADNLGCMQGDPGASCRVGEGDGSTSTTTNATDTDPTDTDPTTTGPPPDCDDEGDLDPDCPEATPYCIQGVCAGCGDGPEQFCANVDAALPVCHAAWGRCVECMADAADACTEDDPFCDDDFTCDGCTEHAQCPNSACNLKTGNCFPTDEVYYVDNSQNCGTGTAGNPFCTFQDALDEVAVGDEVVINVVANTMRYNERIIINMTGGGAKLAVLGLGGVVDFGGQTDDPVVVTTNTGNHLFLADLRFISNTDSRTVVSSLKGELWMDDCVVDDNTGVGIELNDGQLHLRRSQVISNDATGIDTRNGSQMWIESSIIAANGTTAEDTRGIRTSDTEFEIVYTTVVANRSNPLFQGDPAPSNLECVEGGGGPVRNSIFIGENLATVSCPWAEFSNTVLDEPFDGEGNVVIEEWMPMWFANIGSVNYRVRGSGESTPFAGAALHMLGDPLEDLDGEARPGVPGGTPFAGADEP